MDNPREILLGAQSASGLLPVCDHYSGIEARMRKSLALQAELTQEFGACVFDVTLDCEDGAPVGGELDHANMIVGLVTETLSRGRGELGQSARIAVRVHPVQHAAFEQDVQTIVAAVGTRLCHLMVPKVESVRDVDRAAAAVDNVLPRASQGVLPLHVLVESPGAVHRAYELAAHPRVLSVSFGLMDFVSAHGGAIPAQGMSGAGQFRHPLVVRAKLEVSSACHANGKVPAHCVVTEFRDVAEVERAARTAAQDFGYTRMWSIHPGQIRPILSAFAPAEREIEVASEIIERARQAGWAPTEFAGQLHDRASYRYFWGILERAHQTGKTIPPEVGKYFVVPVA